MTARAAPMPMAQATDFSRSLGGLSGPVLMGAVFLAPYATWRLSQDYLFTFSDTLFCAATLMLFAGRSLSLRPFADFTPLWLLGLGTMLMGLLLGSVVNGDPTRWGIVASQYCFAFVLVPMLLMRGDHALCTKLAKALVAGVVVMELFGAIVYGITRGDHDKAARYGFEFITGAHRLGAYMADANANGAMIAMTMPFVLYLSRIGRFGFVMTYASLSILGLALLLCGSFSAFASAAVALATFLVIAGGTRSIRLVIGLSTLALGVAASGFTLPEAFQHRVARALESGDIDEAGTFVGRMELIHEAWGIVEDTPVVGLGTDQYRVVSRDRAPVHNIYLLMWAEGGLGALIGWIVMMMTPILASVRLFVRDRPTAALGLAVSATFLIFSMTAPHMYARSWATALLLATAIVLSRRASPFGGNLAERPAPPKHRHQNR